jgi:hypothetical protein
VTLVDCGDKDTVGVVSFISLVTLWPVSANSKRLTVTNMTLGCQYNIRVDSRMTRPLEGREYTGREV